jgi:CubicO group peptidase (beta-lactamase class C family)
MMFALLRSSILVAGLSTCLPSSAQATTSLEEANRQATAFVQQTMREQKIPGLQLAVVSGGKVVMLENFGFANVENRLPVTGETLFPINSATKSLTGVAVMQLVQDGLVDLDAPLSRYLDGRRRRGVRCASDSYWDTHPAFLISSTHRALLAD